MKYNIVYVRGIEQYKKRNTYTLNILDDQFIVEGIFKKVKFNIRDIKDIKYGDIKQLKNHLNYINDLFNRNNNNIKKVMNYCLIIILDERKIIFSDYDEFLISRAYQELITKRNELIK